VALTSYASYSWQASITSPEPESGSTAPDCAISAHLLAPLLPPPVVLVELTGDAVPEVLPTDAPLTSRAVPRRVAEFASGRWCAERALRQLGISGGPVGIGPHREPLWPAGVVGSITHSGSFRAAAVAHAVDVAALGIDVEAHRALPSEVADIVLTPGERIQFAGDGGVLQLAAFSTKEAIFKAWFSRTGLWLDFLDVVLEYLPPRSTSRAYGSFQVHPTALAPVSPELELRELRCVCLIGNEYVAATAYLPGPRT
jgi:4'-phosphopantetheinyl transferase EntD